MDKFKKIKLVTVLSLISVVAACGGGGGSSSSSGTTSNQTSASTGQVLAGVPMSNALITIKSLSDETTATARADENGEFTIPSGVSAPALITATSVNGAYTYYGYWKSATQTKVAINPLTTTLLAIAANANPGQIRSSLSDSSLEYGLNATNRIFSQVFAAASVSGSIDILSQTFSPDHTGLDLVLDSIVTNVKADGSVDITNKFNGSAVNVKNGSIATLPFDASSINLLASAPIKQCSEMLGKLDSAKMSADGSVYDSGFVSYGKTKARFMQYIQEISTSAPFAVSMPVFSGLDGNGNYVFNLLLVNSATKEFISDMSIATKLNANECKLIGDQLPFEITIQPAIKHRVRVDDAQSDKITSSPFAGVEIQIGSNNTQNLYKGTRAKYAKVEVCDVNNACNLLATLTASDSGVGFNLDSSNYSGVNYSFLNMVPNPSFSLTNGISNPIKVSFFDLNRNLIDAPVYTRSTADRFLDAEIASIVQPIVANAGSLATSPALKISMNYDSGSTVASSVSVNSVLPNAQQVSTEKLILKKGAGTIEVSPISFSNSDSYRAIYISGHIPGRNGMIETKYIWAPTCSSCY
ncbi:MAG: carboxypeptidase-like regulatory domain-containing protein [Fluviibacter phosphoraccumulans]